MLDSSKSFMNEQQKKSNKTQSIFKDNIIRITRRIVRNMKDDTQKFDKAKAHLIDALNYKHPRYESQSLDTPRLFRICYSIHMNKFFEWILYVFGYMFMFMVIADRESYVTKIVIQSIILSTFVFDLLIIIYCKQMDTFEKTSKYSSLIKAKLILNMLMIIDLIVFITMPGWLDRPVRPFRVLRCLIPLLYDSEMRKTLKAFASAYKDSLVYIIFFSIVVIGYALIGSRSLTFDSSFKDPSVSQPFDFYKTNYNDLRYMIFTVYVTATYDSYPDNQLLVLQNSQANYIYFIVFIFFNMFVFSSIPGSLIYLKFRETRSKIIILDELRQQHSLILAFVTLAQNHKDLDVNRLIQFLLYLYRYKIRYIEYITDICLKLDDNNNRYIQVNEFMQISKILLENEAMLPPSYDDVKLWIDFRKFVNRNLHLKAIVKDWKFQLVISIIILLSFINAIFVMYSYSTLAARFDDFFIWAFAAELLIRVIAVGPENLFMDKWNYVDTFLVFFGIAFFFIPTDSGFEGIARIYRIFRLATLVRLVSRKKMFKKFKFQIWSKVTRIFSIMLQISPIILKFMPLFFFFFFIFGIVGMQIFYDLYKTSGSPAYNQYRQFSDFQTFIHTQYIMVQVLTEAGWSQLAFDHSWRAPQYAVYIMLYFCLMHIMIVYILATLIKGIFWQVFFTVDRIFQERNHEHEVQEQNDEIIAEKALQIEQINVMIENEQYIEPNTVLKRQIIENKLDLEIFSKLKNFFEKDKGSKKMTGSKKSFMTHHIIDQWNIDVNQLQISQNAKKQLKNRGEQREQNRNRKPSLNQIEEIDKQDIESEMSEILNKIIINPKIKYHQLVITPKIFVQFLKSKFRSPEQLIDQDEFDLHLNPLYNQKSMELHAYEINSMLGIQTSKRQHKAMIIETMIKENIITEQKGEELIRKKLQEKIFHIDTNGIIRSLFLSDTNQDLVKKFEIQYFSDLYGYSFKHINKMTIQPLLMFQSTLNYSLKNILRYPQIDNTQFFKMLTTIEQKFSNQLLQHGSLFKFIYKLDYEGEIWFSIEYKQQQQMKIHFIKTGIWCYYKEMKDKKILYARDVFNWQMPKNKEEECQQYIKKFYQSFEGLAFSLLNQQKFFQSNPKTHVYDLYIEHFDVQKVERFKNTKLQISKIMVVILSKQQQRNDIGTSDLTYGLSDIISKGNNKDKKLITFKFDDSDAEAFNKLKNIAAAQNEKIVDTEGLPFAYMINLMKDIEDMISIYSKNFVYQIEKVLNNQYEEMKFLLMMSQGLKQSRKDDSPKKKQPSVNQNFKKI